MMSWRCFPPIIVGLVLALAASPAASAPCATCDSLCGPRSLLAASRDLKITATLDEIVSATSKDLEPAVRCLIPAIEKLGLSYKEERLSFDTLSRMKVQFLALLTGNHIVYVRSDGSGGLLVDDPDHGRLTADQFKQEFTGVALLLGRDSEALCLPGKDIGPSMRPDWYVTDFGDVDQGSVVEKTLTLKNVGTEDLAINSVRATCGCASAVLSDSVVHPGGEAAVKVTINTAGRQGMQYYRLYISSNDSVTPVLQLGIIGTSITPKVVVYPEKIDLGTLSRGECAFQELYVYDSGGRDFKVTKAESDSSYIKCFPASISDRKHPRYVVVVELSPDAPSGKFAANVTVTTTHPKNPVVKVPVEGEISGEAGIPTHSVFLGIVPQGHGSMERVEVASSGPSPLKVESVENSMKYLSVEVESKDDRSCAVVLKTDKDTPEDTVVRGDVVLRTNDPAQPEIRLRVYGRVTTPNP